jgi:hypothetical protein
MAIEMPRIDLGGLRNRLPDMDRSGITKDMKLPEIDLKDLRERADIQGAGKALGEGVDAVAQRLDEIGRDIRSIRIVRGPEPRVAPAAGAGIGLGLLAGLGIGMALMYFFDPREGMLRRERLMATIKGLFSGGGSSQSLQASTDAPPWQEDATSLAGAGTDVTIGTSDFDAAATQTDLRPTSELVDEAASADADLSGSRI